MSQIIDIKIEADQLEGTEATFSAWLVKQGDHVEQGQPLAELETDKVAMEVCALESGVIESLNAKNGDQIEPDQSLGKIAVGIEKENIIISQKEAAHELKLTQEKEVLTESESSGKESISPAVRRLLNENNLSVGQIQGSGKRDRVTRNDVLDFLNSNKIASVPSIKNQSGKNESATTKASSPFEPSIPTARALIGNMQPHSNMRKSIASHMVSSLLETSPHVTSVFEMDMGNIIEHRKWHKKEYEECGVKLTFTAYFLLAMAKAVAAVPQVNAKFHDDALEIFNDVNIGVGTALGDDGLVVPVVNQVQSMNLFQIAKALSINTEKARTGNLKPSDMKNGTLTISNHGVSGSLFATPIIINQPQVAILGIGKLEKRVVVEQVDGEDTMVIRPKCYVSLSIDHRALDAHQTNLYLSEFVRVIETWGS